MSRQSNNATTVNGNGKGRRTTTHQALQQRWEQVRTPTLTTVITQQEQQRHPNTNQQRSATRTKAENERTGTIHRAGYRRNHHNEQINAVTRNREERDKNEGSTTGQR